MRGRKSAAVLAALLLALSVCGCQSGPASSSSIPASSQAAPSASASSAPALPELPVANGTSPLTGLPLPEGAPPNQRPVSVMVANTQRAWPQRGLAQAELMFEMLTEGGITRLMAVYPGGSIPQVGPVRSTRDQFVQFAAPMNSIHVHIGSSIYARNLLNTLAYQDVDGLYLGTTAFVFDVQRTLPKESGKLNENCWFTDAGLLAQGVAAVGLPTEAEVRDLFRFADGPQTGGDPADWLYFTFSGVSPAGFDYNPEAGLYFKTAFGLPHTDEDGAPLAYTNVFLLFCPITLKPDGQCTEFDLREGTGVLFNGGKASPITWKKGGPSDRLRLFGQDGSELPVQKGRSYIGILPEEMRASVGYGAAGQTEPTTLVPPPPADSAPSAAPAAEPPPEDPVSIV